MVRMVAAPVGSRSRSKRLVQAHSEVLQPYKDKVESGFGALVASLPREYADHATAFSRDAASLCTQNDDC